MAADCKSATLRVTEVRILPCAPLVFADAVLKVVASGECIGSKPGRQRTDGDCAGFARIVGDSRLADDGAGQVPVANVDPVRIFCLPCHTRTASFAVGLLGQKSFSRLFLVLEFYKAGVAQW